MKHEVTNKNREKMKTHNIIRYGILAGSVAIILFLLFPAIVIAQDEGREEAENHPKDSGDSEDFSFPPEWEPHEAVWIDWPDMQPYPEIYQTKIKMIDALHRNVNVKLLTHADSLKELAVKMMLSENIDTSRVEILFHEIPNYFIRDAGPKYLTNGQDYMIATSNGIVTVLKIWKIAVMKEGGSIMTSLSNQEFLSDKLI
jgi:hypothetical protein